MRRSSRQSRQRSSGLSGVPSEEIPESGKEKSPPVTSQNSAPRKRSAPVPRTRDDASNSEYDGSQGSDQEVSKKKRKIGPRAKKGPGKGNALLFQQLFGIDRPACEISPCRLPQRAHGPAYHRPLLLDSREGRAALLGWFDSVSSRRSMPWRKRWIDPREADDPALLRGELERRAYEVWISEIMLQQTRVAVVVDYWEKWMALWPTIHELAAAGPDDVLAAWRGLGYYSRATRIHDAAKLVCGDPAMGGLLPSDVDELVAKVPGVGPYTAGAISAIVFGKAAPMVDGNVLRVLSRQLGLLGNVKTNKPVIDLLWAAADSLAKAVAADASEDEDSSDAMEERISDRPGRWGQALMELGSTVCTPNPDCAACPITASCRAYGEGLRLASAGASASKRVRAEANRSPTPDIEDLCSFCTPFEEVSQADSDKNVEAGSISKKSAAKSGADKPRTQRQATLSGFFAVPDGSTERTASAPKKRSLTALATAVDHAKKFPVKAVKKAVKEQETLVCAIRRSDGRYLIHRRPQKGLLAGLWEFPSWIVPGDHDGAATAEQQAAVRHASGVLGPALKKRPSDLKYAGKLGSVPWLFSHLKLTMHVFLFELKCSDGEFDPPPSSDDRWSSSVEEESMGTGMRKCWELVREVNGD